MMSSLDEPYAIELAAPNQKESLPSSYQRVANRHRDV
jgi:hypothetical protein